MRKYTYNIRLEPAEEGGYNVFVPALPGCVTQGETYEDAVAMAEDVIKLWIQALADDGKPVPKVKDESDAQEASETKLFSTSLW